MPSGTHGSFCCYTLNAQWEQPPGQPEELPLDGRPEPDDPLNELLGESVSEFAILSSARAYAASSASSGWAFPQSGVAAVRDGIGEFAESALFVLRHPTEAAVTIRQIAIVLDHEFFGMGVFSAILRKGTGMRGVQLSTKRHWDDEERLSDRSSPSISAQLRQRVPRASRYAKFVCEYVRWADNRSKYPSSPRL